MIICATRAPRWTRVTPRLDFGEHIGGFNNTYLLYYTIIKYKNIAYYMNYTIVESSQHLIGASTTDTHINYTIFYLSQITQIQPQP